MSETGTRIRVTEGCDYFSPFTCEEVEEAVAKRKPIPLFQENRVISPLAVVTWEKQNLGKVREARAKETAEREEVLRNPQRGSPRWWEQQNPVYRFFGAFGLGPH